LDDILDYELEFNFEDLGHEGILEDVKFEIDKKDSIIRIKIGLY